MTVDFYKEGGNKDENVLSREIFAEKKVLPYFHSSDFKLHTFSICT